MISSSLSLVPRSARLRVVLLVGEEGVSFKSMGQTFNFVNEVPLHAMAKKYTTSSLIFVGRRGQAGRVRRGGGRLEAARAVAGQQGLAGRRRECGLHHLEQEWHL